MPHHTQAGSGSDPQVVRRTVAAPAKFAGVTLFTGVQSSVTVRPAEAGQGIVLRRVDLAGYERRPIPVSVEHVISENRRTVLVADPKAEVGVRGAEREDFRVQTVEHLLGALAGLAITDAVIDVDGPEVPVGDGSALPFVEMIREVGTRTVVYTGSGVETVLPLVIREPIVLKAGGAGGAGGGEIAAYPSEKGDYRVEYHLDYGAGSPIPAQSASATLVPGSPCRVFAEEIAPARTFCLAEEAMAMRKMGLFHHLTPSEMLVIGEQDGKAGPIDNAYRFADEPARHKLLDVVGDLMLVGRPIIGRIVAKRSGHALNHAMARAIAKTS